MQLGGDAAIEARVAEQGLRKEPGVRELELALHEERRIAPEADYAGARVAAELPGERGRGVARDDVEPRADARIGEARIERDALQSELDRPLVEHHDIAARAPQAQRAVQRRRRGERPATVEQHRGPQPLAQARGRHQPLRR